MTGDRLKMIGRLLGFLTMPFGIVLWWIPQDTWDKWAERYF